MLFTRQASFGMMANKFCISLVIDVVLGERTVLMNEHRYFSIILKMFGGSSFDEEMCVVSCLSNVRSELANYCRRCSPRFWCRKFGGIRFLRFNDEEYGCIFVV